MNDLYNTIKGMCSERGVSIRKMAIEAGIAPTSISDLKSGRLKSLSLASLNKVANYFGLPVEYFVMASLPDEMREEQLVDTWRLIRNEDLMKIFWEDSTHMDEEDLDELKEYAKFMARWKLKRSR